MIQPKLRAGEVYGGAIITPNGEGRHIILLPDELEKATWDYAWKRAQALGDHSDLPDQVEHLHLKKVFFRSF